MVSGAFWFSRPKLLVVRSRTCGHVRTTALVQKQGGRFELTCEDTDRTTRYMAVSRLSMVPRPLGSSLTDLLCSRNGDSTLPRSDRQVDTHGGDRRVEWEPRQGQERLSDPRLRTICSFNQIVRTEIELGAGHVTTGETSPSGTSATSPQEEEVEELRVLR